MFLWLFGATNDRDQRCFVGLRQEQFIVPLARLLGTVLAGGTNGQLIFNGTLAQVDPTITPPWLATLNQDPDDGGGLGISGVLTAQQEALLGCGPYYGQPCVAPGRQLQGMDLFNAEASALFQAFPMFEKNAAGQPGGPIATRFP